MTKAVEQVWQVQYCEVIEVDAVECFGSYPVTREKGIDFASRYDSQPIHLNDEAASSG